MKSVLNTDKSDHLDEEDLIAESPNVRKPKRAKSGYLFFMTAVRDQVKRENPKADFVEIAKIIGRKWGNLGTEDKQVDIQAQFYIEISRYGIRR
jgi:hypothetical protein